MIARTEAEAERLEKHYKKLNKQRIYKKRNNRPRYTLFFDSENNEYYYDKRK